MKTAIVLTGLLLPVSAHATDWYILNASTAQCLSATTFSRQDGLADFRSPKSLEVYLRKDGTFDSTNVNKDGEGNILFVMVHRTDGIGILYFPGKDACNLGRRVGLKTGVINDPEELR